MSFYICFNEQGKAMLGGYLGAVPLQDYHGYSPETHKVFEGELPNLELVYWDNGLKEMPTKPSEYHWFNYSNKSWVLHEERAMAEVRRQRDTLLAKSDWVRLRHLDLGTAIPPEWLTYRQALRDIPLQPDPLNIVWPEQPTT